ncbi:MAG: hypothetical protein ACE5Q6_00880 [Dehalococcoidia bacterium]
MRDKTFKRGNETQLTYQLKWAAWEWLYTVAQCRCVGLEVRLEGPGGRVVDLVGVGPENAVYVVEVKASRSDFARDDHRPQELAALRAKGEVLAQKCRLAEQILIQATDYAKTINPEAWEEVPAYRTALADCQRLAREQSSYQDRLVTYSIKLRDPRFLGIADYHYLMAPRGLIPRHKVPPQWGLLDPTPEVVVPAPQKDTRKNTGITSNILRSIARSNTTSMMRSQGVMFTEDGAVFPKAEPDQA